VTTLWDGPAFAPVVSCSLRFVGDLFEFVRKLWRHWVLLITGSGAIALLALWEHYKGESINLRWFGALALGLFVWACFLAWREERRQTAKPGAPDLAPQPKLEAKIDWVWVAKAADGSPGTHIILVASLANPGRPSTADDWTLVAQLSDGRVEQAVLQQMPRHLSVEQSGERHDFSSEAALYEAAIAAPIPTGGKIRGALWFHIRSMAPEEVSRQGCHLILHARTTFGEFLSAAASFGATDKTVPLVFAGLRR
jgi:hypothetical protein